MDKILIKTMHANKLSNYFNSLYIMLKWNTKLNTALKKLIFVKWFYKAPYISIFIHENKK